MHKISYYKTTEFANICTLQINAQIKRRRSYAQKFWLKCSICLIVRLFVLRMKTWTAKAVFIATNSTSQLSWVELNWVCRYEHAKNSTQLNWIDSHWTNGSVPLLEISHAKHCKHYSANMRPIGLCTLRKRKAVALINNYSVKLLIRKKHTKDMPEKFFSYAASRTR